MHLLSKIYHTQKKCLAFKVNMAKDEPHLKLKSSLLFNKTPYIVVSYDYDVIHDNDKKLCCIFDTVCCDTVYNKKLCYIWRKTLFISNIISENLPKMLISIKMHFKTALYDVPVPY